MQAYARRDKELAREVWESDGEIDTLHTALFRELLTYMMEDPRSIGYCTHLLFCAKNLERIGDHATNIAENIHYVATGEFLSGDRPKGQNPSNIVINTPADDHDRRVSDHEAEFARRSAVEALLRRAAPGSDGDRHDPRRRPEFDREAMRVPRRCDPRLDAARLVRNRAARRCSKTHRGDLRSSC